MKIPESFGMVMDGVAASQVVDSSGEVIEIDGVDCSQAEEEDAGILLNYEHRGEGDDEGASNIVGRVIYFKKIFSASDCENDRQRMYWQSVRENPYIYVVCRLFDGSGHENAKALAAIVRDNAAHGEALAVRYSIEGTTMSKEGNRIKSSLWRRLACTLRPCNKTAVSGLLQDNAKVGKSERVDPDYTRLGGALEVVGSPLIDDADSDAALRILGHAAALRYVRKALTAGGGDVAPSALTGGAALAREDVQGRALAALRDYGAKKKFRRSEFKDFAKARLPEVSDSFIDHFTDVAEAASLKRTLAKKDATTVKPKLPKGGTPKAPAQAPSVIVPARHQAVNHAVLEDLPDEQDAEPDAVPGSGGRKLASLTYRGKPTTPNPGMRRPVFDAEKGILHTPAGSIKAYLPEHDGAGAAAHYQKILAHPDIERAMDTALTHWTQVHKLLKEGKLPPEIVMHAVLFSQLSPNKPVPTQEIQYARLADAMDATGIDPREPGFEAIEEPYRQLDRPDTLPHTAREEFRRNPAYYTGGKIGVEHDAEGNKAGKPSLETGRYPGELLSARPLFQDFLGRASQYHKLHHGLVDLVNRHRANGLDAVTEMMGNKAAQQRHYSNTRAAAKAGKSAPAPYQGLSVPGLKVKTGLYTYGMLGGGDSVVPDTHFVRNMYGLDLDKDQHTIEYLKQMHWRPTNMDAIMKPLNAWYLKHHPAVQYTLNHPKWGSAFSRPQDALFPSFWRHWLTIQPHEAHLGLPNMSEQAGTTHAPYWETIRPHVEEALARSEDHDSSVALRTAMVHQQYVRDYGEVPAQLLYYHHLVPRLLEAAQRRRRVGNDLQFLAKARELEAGLVELRKSITDALDGPEEPDVRAVAVVGHDGQARRLGRFLVHNNAVHHLEDYHGAMAGLVPEGPLNAVAVSRLHGLQWAPDLRVAAHAVPRPAAAVPAGAVAVTASSPPPPPPVFEYHRPGLSAPHVVEFGPRGAALDGRALTDAELALMARNHASGLATIRYKRSDRPQEDLAKADDTDMAKRDDENLGRRHVVPPPLMGPEDALAHVRAAVAAGHIHPDVERAMTRHLMEDPMVEGVGNKAAWQAFQAKQKPGVYLSMDGNDFRHVNNNHGHAAGDAAITAMGGALRAAAAKTGNGKLFRAGGDEFAAHFPSYEDASRFVRHARQHLDAVPPVNGVHKLSMSFGLGNDYGTADQALYHAKAQKLDAKTGQAAFPVGKVPNLAHSLVPGTEGAMTSHVPAVPLAHLPKAPAPANTNA